MNKVQVELVQAQTTDGFRLDGALHPARVSADSAFDGAILLSGVGSNFYGSRLIEHIAVALEDRGIAALRTNTRGHDNVCTCVTNMGVSLQGAAYEIVDDCRHDVNAWAKFLASRGCIRLVLIGHSLGAIKAIYSQVHEPNENIKKVIAISPPRLSYRRFLSSPQADLFRNSMTQAEQLMADNQPQSLFQASFPFPCVMSAATYVDKYGSAERYNILRYANKINCPVHFIYGEKELAEPTGAFDEILAELQTLDWSEKDSRFTLIAQANHFYVGTVDELIEQIAQSFNKIS